RVAWGAKTITEGGFYSLPRRFNAPGLLLVGEGAGLVNVPRLKGIHYAIESGRLAAEAAFRVLERGEVPSRIGALDSYDASLRRSGLWQELYEVRNMRQAFDKGFFVGGALASAMTVTKGHAPNGRRPAHVYEVGRDLGEGMVSVHVTPSNCVQCGAITAKGGQLTPPEGGSGPEYTVT